MKLLLTNDDGITAPGLAALEQAAREFGDIVSVAPDRCFSSCGHGVTTHRELTVTEVAPRRYMVDGSPADCVRIGLLRIAPDADWLVAGVNNGGNLGVDIYMSGTVAAAREAMLLGRKAIAISQYRRSRDFQGWPKAMRMAEVVLRELVAQPPQTGTFWNVNFPDVPGDDVPPRVMCPADLNPLPVAYEDVESKLRYSASYQSRLRTAGHDVDVCFGGAISVSLLRHGF